MKYTRKDITEVKSGIIAHGVNCLRVMGSGAALAIRNKWPIVYERYRIMPMGKEMLGQAHFIYVDEGLYVANCYTQLNFGGDGRRYASIDAVRESLGSCFSFADLMELPLNTVKIASDLGGLDWETEVKPIYEELEEKFPDVDLTIYYI